MPLDTEYESVHARPTTVDKPRRPKTTYQATPVVWIEVLGERAHEEDQRRHAMPLCPRDGGLVLRLMKFMEEKGIYRAIRAGWAGGGGYGGGFYEPHAKMIMRFLRKEGCKRTKQK